MEYARRLVGSLVILLASGCASMETPSVTLSSLRVESSTLLEQRFLTTLRVQNPHTFDLDVEGGSFDLEVNEQPFAKGVGKGNVVVRAYGTGVIEAEAITTLMAFACQLKGLAQPDGPKLLPTGGQAEGAGPHVLDPVRNARRRPAEVPAARRTLVEVLEGRDPPHDTLPARCIGPVGFGTPPAGSSVTAKVSKVWPAGNGGTRSSPRPPASTVKTPAGTGSAPAIAQSS
jgi:Late embryogenesis abundant protein